LFSFTASLKGGASIKSEGRKEGRQLKEEKRYQKGRKWKYKWKGEKNKAKTKQIQKEKVGVSGKDETSPAPWALNLRFKVAY